MFQLTLRVLPSERLAAVTPVSSGKTLFPSLSQLASTTLGWSSDVWDFTGDLPTLK